MIAFRLAGGLFLFIPALFIQYYGDPFLLLMFVSMIPLSVPVVSLVSTVLDNVFKLNPTGSIILEATLSFFLGASNYYLVVFLMSWGVPVYVASAIGVMVSTLTAYYITIRLEEEEEIEI